MESLIELAQDPNALIHEAYDSDVAIVHEIIGAVRKGIALVQFKYSERGVDTPIDIPEFKKILDSFLTAEKRVGKDNAKVTGIHLITNRVYRDKTECVAVGHNSKVFKDDLTTDQRRIATILKHESGIEPEFWRERLYLFGKTFGLRDDEVAAGCERLLGFVIEQTVAQGTCEIMQHTLIERLTGSREARQITHASLAGSLVEHLDELGPPPNCVIVERSTAQEEYAAFANRAVILLTGLGGTGKTATLRKWAEAETATSFVAARRSAAVTQTWIHEQIAGWRCIYGQNESSDAALSRLRTANPNSSIPILHLAIDGVDECLEPGQHANGVRELVRWFHECDKEVTSGRQKTPTARLLVTCRNASDFEGLWAPNPSGLSMNQSDPPPEIRFGDFSEDEFAQLVEGERVALGESMCDRLMQSVATPIGVTEEGYVSVDLQSSARGNVGPSNALLLRQPTMWACFLHVSSKAREAFLQDEKEGRFAVASRFVDRFTAKVASRCNHLCQRESLAALKALAIISRSEGSAAQTVSRWHAVVSAALGDVGAPARRLLAEALSAGLVDEEQFRWRWRYQFVADYLADSSKEANSHG